MNSNKNNLVFLLLHNEILLKNSLFHYLNNLFYILNNLQFQYNCINTIPVSHENLQHEHLLINLSPLFSKVHSLHLSG